MMIQEMEEEESTQEEDRRGRVALDHSLERVAALSVEDGQEECDT